jgi:hypothetical protein
LPDPPALRGIVGFDDRFKMASSTNRLSSRDPNPKFTDLDFTP